VTSDTNQSELLTEVEVAGILKMKRQTLRNWRGQRVGPRFIKLRDRSVRYRRGDVEEWIEEQASRPL
jgi:predicted DNA-binding transcriptional regulator AlpA